MATRWTLGGYDQFGNWADPKEITYTEAQLGALNEQFPTYTNPSFSTGYKMQPGFTVGAESMGYNIAPAGQGVSRTNS